MENNELNKKDELEQVADVSSLISLCQRDDNLSLLKEVAIDQEVSFIFERFLHKYMYNGGVASRRFGAYRCLVNANPALYGNYCDRLVNYVSEDDIEEMLMYIRTGIIPYQIMVEKLIADINSCNLYQASSRAGMLTVFLMKVMRCSIKGYFEVMKALRAETHLPEDCERILDLVEARYFEYPQDIKEAYMRTFNTDVEEMRRKFMDNELTLFSETFFDMIRCPLDMNKINDLEKGLINVFTPIWVEPDMFGGMGGLQGGASQGALMTPPTMTNAQMPGGNQRQGMGSFLEDVLGRKAEELNAAPAMSNAPIEAPKQEETVQEHKITNENPNIGYLVKKVAKDSSNRVVSKRMCPTPEAAQEYIDYMTKSSPEMRNNFDFVVEPVPLNPDSQN